MAETTNVAELVAQLPPTDAEADAGRSTSPGKPTPSGKTAASKFTGPKPEESARLVEAVLAGGRAGLLELVSLLRDPASPDFTSYKAEYLLHCVVLYAGQPGKEGSRKVVVSALGSALTDDSLPGYVRGFLLRELQWIGSADAATALGAVLIDRQFSADAAAALVAIGGEAAARELRAAWPKAEGAPRLAILHALAQLRDPQANDLFRGALGSSDEPLRLTAAWGLAHLGLADSTAALLKWADAATSFERLKANGTCLLLAERLAADGNRRAAAQVYAHLRDKRQAADERHIREAAGKALAALEADQ
jgi:hypothetical protein